MEDDPHRVLEGMIICAYAVGASYGYFYIRGEYPIAMTGVLIFFTAGITLLYRTDSTNPARRSFTNNCSRYGSEMSCRFEISASDNSAPSLANARSVSATMAYLPFVESFIARSSRSNSLTFGPAQLTSTGSAREDDPDLEFF